MLKFEHVTKVYGGKKALNDLSISFQSGHVYALVGPNGSGKSTMMKAAAGLVKANTGSVTYQDMPIGVESKKHISYMSTEPFYYDYMKIRDVGQFYADFFEDFDGSRFASLLQFMQLTPDLIYSAINLDGGNVVLSPSGGRALVSDRIFAENPDCEGEPYRKACYHCHADAGEHGTQPSPDQSRGK